jgi:hypothetical protein
LSFRESAVGIPHIKKLEEVPTLVEHIVSGHTPKYHIRVESSEEGAIGEWDCDAYLLAIVESPTTGLDGDDDEIIQSASNGMGPFKRLGVARWQARLFEDEVAGSTREREEPI